MRSMVLRLLEQLEQCPSLRLRRYKAVSVRNSTEDAHGVMEAFEAMEVFGEFQRIFGAGEVGLIVAKIPPSKDQNFHDMAPGSPNGTRNSISSMIGNNNASSMPKDSELYKAKRIEALRKYEILVEFEKQLIPLFVE
ncbi:hypothetical protein OROHE_011072 [Orobanche hederae]